MTENSQRIRISIDGDSWKLKLIPGPASSVVLFVHGTFGDATETWGTTPQSMLGIPALSQFDIASFGYDSKVFDKRKPKIFSEKLRLWLNTHLGEYAEIYVVAHSMGGLLLRQAICTMLRDAKKNSAVRKIRLCFLVASPVTGSRTARVISKVPFLSWLHARLSYLRNPTIDGLPMGSAYVSAVQAFLLSGGTDPEVPRFHVFTAESDKLVGQPFANFFTKYDNDEGIVPGSHGSAKLDQDANSSLLARISQLVVLSSSVGKHAQESRIQAIKASTREREQAALSTPRVTSWAAGKPNEIDLLLISCSNTKSDSEQIFYEAGNSITDMLADPSVRQLVYETRNRVVVSVQGAQIDGLEFKEGNRASKPANKALKFGPDIGGQLNEKVYLPAYKRYKGRCYQASPTDWESLLRPQGHPHVLIMSGLYGLILPTDPIQNYDVHITDVDRSSGLNLQSYWKDRELMTEILLSHIKWIEQNKGPIGRIVDCLSELSYQETINWSLLEHRWPVFHRVFEKSAGRDSLENLGIWIRDVLQQPKLLKEIQPDLFYENAGFTTPDRIAFEQVIGLTRLPVMRQVKE